MRGSNWGEERPSGSRRGRWSQAEIARLRELYALRDEKAIARELNRSLAGIRKMAESIFRQPVRTGPWTAEELEGLKKYLGATTSDVVSQILGRTVEDIETQVEDLRGKQVAGRWTQDEIAEFKRLYGTRTDEDLALIFARTIESVKRLGARYCLAKDKAFVRRMTGSSATRMPRWTPEEEQRLKEIYPSESNLRIAQILNRSVKSVISKAHNMGLKKDPTRLREMGRENVSLRYKRTSQ